MAVTMITLSLIIIVLLFTVAIMEGQMLHYQRRAQIAERRLADAQRELNRLKIAHDMSAEIAETAHANEQRTRIELLGRVRSLEDTLTRRNTEIIHLKTASGWKGASE